MEHLPCDYPERCKDQCTRCRLIGARLVLHMQSSACGTGVTVEMGLRSGSPHSRTVCYPQLLDMSPSGETKACISPAMLPIK